MAKEQLNPIVSFAAAGPEVSNYKLERFLTPGWYKAVIKKSKVEMSKNGNPQVVLMVGVDGGAEGGVLIFHYVPVKACSFRSTMFEGLGLSNFDKSDAKVDVREFVGLETMVKTKNEKDLYGEDRAKIADMKPVKNLNEPSRRFPFPKEPEGEYEDAAGGASDTAPTPMATAAAPPMPGSMDDFPF